MRTAPSPDRISRRRMLTLALSPVAGLVADMARADSERAGSVKEVRGEAFAEANTVRRELEPEGPLFVRDQVRTGEDSRLIMRLGRATTIRVGEKALLEIDHYMMDLGGEIELKSGPVLFDRPAGAPPSSLRIRSPFGLIAVRGTRFFAGPSDGWFGVFVERGVVSVTAAGQEVVLGAGQGTTIRWPGAAPTRPAQWRDRRIRAALASIA